MVISYAGRESNIQSIYSAIRISSGENHATFKSKRSSERHSGGILNEISHVGLK